MATGTYDLYFTGRDDPRSCVVIGEDTKPIYLVFETSHVPTTRTTVSSVPPYPFVRALVVSKKTNAPTLIIYPPPLLSLCFSFMKKNTRSTETTKRSSRFSTGSQGTALGAPSSGLDRYPCPISCSPAPHQSEIPISSLSPFLPLLSPFLPFLYPSQSGYHY